MPRTPRAGALVPQTRPLRSSAQLHMLIAAVRFVGAVVTATAFTGITSLMWAVPWQTDALLTVIVAAGWCVWLDDRGDHRPW
jgi:hypothetical protein